MRTISKNPIRSQGSTTYKNIHFYRSFSLERRAFTNKTLHTHTAKGHGYTPRPNTCPKLCNQQHTTVATKHYNLHTQKTAGSRLATEHKTQPTTTRQQRGKAAPPPPPKSRCIAGWSRTMQSLSTCAETCFGAGA